MLADRGLHARGWETLLVHGDVEPDEAEMDLAGVRPAHPPAAQPATADPSRRRCPRVRASVVAIIRDYRPHVIHTHLSKAGLIGRAAAIATSRAVRVHTFHGTIFGGYFGSTMTGGIVRAERVARPPHAPGDRPQPDAARSSSCASGSPRARGSRSSRSASISPASGPIDRTTARATLGIAPDGDGRRGHRPARADQAHRPTHRGVRPGPAPGSRRRSCGSSAMGRNARPSKRSRRRWASVTRSGSSAGRTATPELVCRRGHRRPDL